MNKLKQFYKLFTIGQQVAHPEFWKRQQAVVQPIVAGAIMLLVTILKGFGYDLPISDELAFTIAGAIFFAVNSALTIITSKKVGLRTDESPVPSVQQGSNGATQTEAVQDDIRASMGHNSIDESVRKRAEEWVKRETLNGLSNDA